MKTKIKLHFDWQAVLKAGATAAAPALLLSLIGMVVAFGQRYIIQGVLTIGHTLLFMNMVLAAVLAVRQSKNSHKFLDLLGGALAGLIPAVLIAAWVAVGQFVNLRAVFINSSPELYKLLTFNQQWGVGLAILVAVSALLGLATTVVQLLQPQIRRAITVAVLVVLLVGLLQDLLRVMFQGWGSLGYAFVWIFPPLGMSIIGVATVFVVAGGLSLAGPYIKKGWQKVGTLFSRVPDPVVNGSTWVLGAGIGALLRPKDVPVRKWAGYTLLFWLIVLLAVRAPYILGSYPSEVLDTVGIFALMGLGLNIVVGFAGLLDLGYVAFFAIGAYTMGLLTSPEYFVLEKTGMQPWSFWAALPVAMITALCFGIILGIPVLNTRGDYLAIVTLGFGEIVRLVFLSDWLRPFAGGAQGIQGIPNAKIGSFVFKPPQEIYFLIVLGCLIVVFVATRLKDSRMGRAWMAVREDEDVAQAVGIELVKTKLLAFATGATFAGLSGAIFASKLGSIYPHSFQLLYSIYVLSLLIVGGMGSIPGAIVGSLLLMGLPELLREFAEYRMLVYGAVLVFMMLKKPEGFMPAQAGRRRKLEAAEE